MASHHTQWAAQFAVASELCKRGYEVSFTMGNHTPLADLVVVSTASRSMFLIDVKGQANRNFWRVRGKAPTEGLFYVFAYVPQGAANQFWVLSQSEVARLMAKYEKSGVKFDERFSGFNWTALRSFEDRWQDLPG